MTTCCSVLLALGLWLVASQGLTNVDAVGIFARLDRLFLDGAHEMIVKISDTL